MPDVMDVLRALPSAVTPDRTSPDVVAGDVARGNRALTRRRRQRFAWSIAIAAAVAVVGAGQFGGAMPTTTAAGGPAPTATQATRLQLVAYTGAQPVGFEVSTVPQGWRVVSSDRSMFVVAPPGKEPAPPAPGHAVSLQGQISVSLQSLSRLPEGTPVTQVDVNGRAGQLGFPWEAEGKLSDVRWLIFPDAAGRRILVQVPGALGLGDDQIVHFAEGVTVTDEAQTVGG
ncbi:hypothetical protein E1258_08885 [Micromonospora sp. KC207]|uniref:hypothetical protein n=1 Tax=Micromonospora sp. KC207 TaxID=2530377 RepID=UPI001047E385|nr:hypothetical protein [Micromonospora sp. KC207]TDC64156.1 hypothetical protein E1258_08885 [Micromonospora sp. KC207]